MEGTVTISLTFYDNLKDMNAALIKQNSELVKVNNQMKEIIFEENLMTFKFKQFELDRLLDFNDVMARAITSVELLKSVGFSEAELKRRITARYQQYKEGKL